ncbi:protein PRD1-like [Selaginella moellendorffii]|uniref:protein PRD1-like n=1 Tax=Selaginella moellendorffii TaxID=88036 RepID=UPI000D1CD698|nr:protein PRD1-like [Selaginella moellendorffii]|eukprot:XP_024534434.1 protein PRD1-like [Selaginella moellendorffii]
MGAGCRRGHAQGLFLSTSPGGGGICLGCLAELLVDPSSFVTHKAYALAELSRCLEDEEFCDGFLRYHSHFLAGPLCQSVFFCHDEALAKATVDFILSLCRSTVEEDRALLDDFITFVSMQLGARSTIVWSKGQRFTLHTMGLLLDLHSKMDSFVPSTIQFQDLMENMVLALQHACDDIKGEVLFLLFRISSLKGGMDKLSNWFQKIITLTVAVLLKAESDEIRTNGIALLSVLAKNSIFQLRNQENESQESQNSDAVSSRGNLDFVTTFAEAIKGSLLSSDPQVQLSSLQLICAICPQDVDISKELAILVEEGIADYIFEVLRVSESLSTLAVTAIRALSILSAAKRVFSQRLMLGVESIVRVLEHSSGAGFASVQEDALQLLAAGLSECPGSVNSSKAEQIFATLSSILQQHGDRVQDAEMVEGAMSLSSGTYGAACMAMIALLNVPGFASISSLPQRVLSMLTNVMTSILYDRFLQPKALICSLFLLQHAFVFEVKRDRRTSGFFSTFENKLLPFLAERTRALEDEVAAEAIFAFLTAVVQTKASGNNALGISERLARDKWLSLGFASTGRFRSEIFKKRVLTFVATIIDALDEDDKTDDSILAAIRVLPTDPDDLLALLEQSGAFIPTVHPAVVSIIYTSYMHHDRLVDQEQLLASLEQFVLLHALSLQVHTKCLLQVVSLYAILKQDSSLKAVFSVEAEYLLVTSIQHNGTSVSLSAKIPLSVRDWMLSQEGLKSLCSRHIYNLFRAASSSQVDATPDLEALCSVVEHENGVVLVNSLLHKVALENIGDDMEMLTTVLKRILELKGQLANRFHQKDIISNMRNWYILCGSKVPASTLIPFIELLVRLLHTLTPESTRRKSGLWQDIVNQTMYLFIRRQDCSQHSLTISILAFLCLLCYQFSSGLSFLSDAAAEIFNNKEFCAALTQRVTGSLEEDSCNAEDEQSLCLALVFQLLWLQQCKNGDLEETGALSFENLCRIIYSKPDLPRLLAFCCLSEKFRHLTVSTARLDSVFNPSSLKSMLLLLQGFVLDENDVVQINASSCLLSLLTSKHLTAKQKQTVEESPWYCFLAKEITRELSLCTKGSSVEPRMKLLISLLKISKNYNWFPSAFASSRITSVISALPGREVYFWEVCFFLELLRMKCLESEQVKALSDHYQSFRKARHQQKSLITSSEKQKSMGGTGAQTFGESFQVMIELVLSQCSFEVSETTAVLGKIDEFMREVAKL